MSVTMADPTDKKLKLSLRARRSKGATRHHPVNQLHHDPKPFILLNLLFSIQAAYTGPVLLLAGNRQAQKDRLTLEHACAEADKADLQNVQILKAIEKNTEVMLTILRHVETLVFDHVGPKRVQSE